jgi:glucose/arabinose dehydrogenase
MSTARAAAAVALMAALASGAPPALAQYPPTDFTDTIIVSGVDFPVGMAFLPDGRLLFTEQIVGTIRLLVNGALQPAPVATIPGVRSALYTEQGLLGIAVDPWWPARPYVYVHYDRSDSSRIRVARFTATGDLEFTGTGSLSIDPASRRDILGDIPDASSIHNGGTLRFGPDGYLYVSIGEDGFACAAQDSVSLRGVILRLDVSGLPFGPGPAPPKQSITPPDNPFATHPNENARLVWAYGLRNPFRFFIDPVTADLFIGDVGASFWDEIDWLPASAGGTNFGWPLLEGPAPFTTCATQGPPFQAPIYYYDTGSSSAVVGAIPYRAGASAGAYAFPAEYEGDVFFSDYYYGYLRRLKRTGDTWAIAPAVPGQPSSTMWGSGYLAVADWAVAPDGTLWYVRQHDGSVARSTGMVRRLAYTASVGVPPPSGAPGVRFLSPFPSPARGSVTLRFTLARTSRVTLDVYDERGRLVRRLLDDTVSPGVIPSEAFWDGRSDRGEIAGPGVYFARLTVDGVEMSRRFPLLP